MKLICSIDLIASLLEQDLPRKSKPAGVTLFTLELYQGASLSANTLQRLRTHLKARHFSEITLSEEELIRYQQRFVGSGMHLYLTIYDYVAVEYAQEHGWSLLADKGYLCRYALSHGVAVVNPKELERRCQQRRRLNDSRKASLTKYLAQQEGEKIEEYNIQQFIDDETHV